MPIKSLKHKAEDNMTVKKKIGKQKEEVIKAGNPLDHSEKHKPMGNQLSNSNSPMVGMSKGVTKNMDNYESLRVDCWLSDVVQEKETIEDAYNRISVIIVNQIEYEVERILNE